MSDYIPFEIHVEIIKRLPVKSLAQFRSVSKTWKSLIDSSNFITGYSAFHTQPALLTVRYVDLENGNEIYVSIVDDETFTKQNFPSNVPDLHTKLKGLRVIGKSHGLLCSYGIYRDPGHPYFNSEMVPMAVLWNPSIRKSIGIVVPGVLGCDFDNVVGFGVSPTTNDPTIVMITHVDLIWEFRNKNTSIPWKVQIFTLSSGSWRIVSNNLPGESLKISSSQVVIDRFIYWSGFDSKVGITETGGSLKKELIIAFDMTTHEFRVIDLPDSLSQDEYYNLSISQLWESVAVLKYRKNDMNHVCDVWIMEDSVTTSFKRLFTINTPYPWIKIWGFTKNGMSIMETRLAGYEEAAALEIYDPSSENITDVEIYGEDESYFVGSYMETLLLIDQLDGRIYSSINWEYARNTIDHILLRLEAEKLRTELGLGVDLCMTYRSGGNELVMADQIEKAISCLMDDDQNPVRNKVKEISDKSRKALKNGGSSFVTLQKLVEDMLSNIE